MKKGILLLLLAISVTTASAQTWKEWFKQKKTQKEYLMGQIAALRVYLGYVREGYDIVRDGTGLIGDITGGEFSLHREYFGSLKAAGPEIRQQKRIADILVIAQYLRQAYPKILSLSAGGLRSEEIAHAATVYKGLMKAAAADLEELMLVITDGRLEMTEDERLKRINAIYERSLAKKVFLRRFGARVFTLAARRAAGERESKLLQQLYEGEEQQKKK